MALTIGLVGCGNWGRNILRDLRDLGCRVLVADVCPESRERALQAGAAQTVPNAKKLPDCEGYVLATPIPDLAPEALGLLPRSMPIFSEKTLCTTRADADDLRSAGGENQVFVMHKWEYHRGIQALRSIVVANRIGDLKQIHCHRHSWIDPSRRVDALTRLAIHDLTIVRHILGEIPAPAFSLIRMEDNLPVSLLAVLGEGPRGILSVDARHPLHARIVALHGTSGSAVLADSYADHVLVRDDHGEEQVAFENAMPLYEELREFVEYLRGGPRPRCGLDHARDAAVALDALRRMAGVTSEARPSR